MYDDRIYSAGAHSMLLVEWRLRCATPLAVRNGSKLSYTESQRYKTRGDDLHLLWRAKQSKTEQEVAALHYGYRIDGAGRPQMYHFVPPSSVRGALRSWTIRYLVQPAYRHGFTPPKQDDAAATTAYLATMRRALSESDSGCPLIASLFGLAADTRADEEMPGNAGRLRVEAEPFAYAQLRSVDASGMPMAADAGPDNIGRQMTTRGPLDRMTHASRDGGLHHFLEFCRGQEFSVRLSVANPQDSDIGLVGLWASEIDAGLLRLGALTSIGRGRVSICPEAETYDLWRAPAAPELQGIGHAQQAPGTADVLSGLWTHYGLTRTALTEFRHYLAGPA